jgi:anti-sigma regulatory factor (Ser/Thr protein kinase)
VTGEFLEIDDPSRAAESRRIATKVAEWEKLPAARVADAAIVATELATNLLKHAQRGMLQIAPISALGSPGIEFVAIDRGPGLANVGDYFIDGYSSKGTSGTGLGAIRRLSDEFDIYSQPGKGSVLLARIFAASGDARPAFNLGFTARQSPGESVSGDSWAVRFGQDSLLIMVADGLGHGTLACEASSAAEAAFRASKEEMPVELVQIMHRALRGTRGAAVAVSRIEFREKQVRFAGLGNISGVVVAPAITHSMVSHYGTAGVEARHIRDFVYPWTDDSLIVMHSDGLSAHWNLSTSPGLMQRHPSAISGVLYRDAVRGRDDACVIVGRKRC